VLGAALLTAAPAGAETVARVPVPSMTQIAIDQAYVRWAAVPGAVSYRVTVTSEGGAPAVLQTERTDVVVPLPDTRPGTAYEYSVAALPDEAGVTPAESSAKTMLVRPDRTQLRVMQYNVCAEHCPRLHTFTWRASRIARQVGTARPDVLTVQEGGASTSKRQRVLNRALAGIGYARAKGASTNHTYYRTSTMSARDYTGAPGHASTAEARHGRNGRNRPAPSKVLRQISTNARVLVVNYHLTSLDYLNRDLDRLDEYRDINRAVARARRALPGVPIVKIGDFNSYTQGRSRAYDSDSHRSRVWAQVRRDGFLDAQTVARSASNRVHNTYNRLPGDRRVFGPYRHLDHIFVERGTTATRWALLDRGVSYGAEYSDHDPIWADLEIPSR
jgi:endonuclease/exonuclease/phosphatase family metal-dependent hydrolase